MNILIRIVSLALGWMMPAFAFAAETNVTLTPIIRLVRDLGGVVNLLIPIAISAAILFFIWGLAKFILASGDEKKKAEGKARMIWGIAAIFVIVSLLGIVKFVQGLFDIENETNTVEAPKVNDRTLEDPRD